MYVSVLCYHLVDLVFPYLPQVIVVLVTLVLVVRKLNTGQRKCFSEIGRKQLVLLVLTERCEQTLLLLPELHLLLYELLCVDGSLVLLLLLS